MLKRYRLFCSEALSNFKTIGAVAPSSPQLAKAIVDPLKIRPAGPVKVLEVGPGTGVFTNRILRHLRPGDELDIYELNPRLYLYLLELLKKKQLEERGVTYRVHNADIRTLDKTRYYDFIISGLPLNNFDSTTVNQILDVLMAQLAPSGVLSYFEYFLTHEFKGRFLKPSERERIQQVGFVVRDFIEKHQFACNHVWWNVPPAKARYCRKQIRVAV